MRRRVSVASIPLLVLVAPALAQGVLPLAGTYKIGSIVASFDSYCGPGTQPTFISQDGAVAFAVDGTLSSSAQDHYVCADGSSGIGPVNTSSGRYTVAGSGHVDLDWVTTSPGTDYGVTFLRADGSVAIASTSLVPQDAYLTVLVALSSGRSDADLAGDYSFVRIVQRNPGPAPGAYSMAGVAGTITFDGAGGYVIAAGSTRHQLAFGGTATSASEPASSGAYAVAADGSLTTGIASGAMSADGEFFFWTQRDATSAEMLVGVRKAVNRTAQEIAGAFRIASIANAIAAPALPGSLQTDWGTMTMSPTGAGGGDTSAELYHVDLTPGGPVDAYQSAAGAFTFGPQGDLQLNGTSAAAGGVSADGSLLIALTQPGDSIGLVIGVAAAEYPHAFGQATPGSGGRAPFLQAVGGFPHTGNSVFSLLVGGGRGSAAAILGLSVSPPTAGLPLSGGTVYLDVNQPIATQLLFLSGPAGVAGIGAAAMQLPLPNSPLLAGLGLTCQAFVFDLAAPQGVAMSSGFNVLVCR